jgi:hypothetical protein
MEYYNARLLTDHADSGDDHDKINRAISILIAYPILVKETDFFRYLMTSKVISISFLYKIL